MLIEVIFMAETAVRYEEQLEPLYQKQLHQKNLNEEEQAQLKALVEHPKEPMDSASFMKIMYLYGVRYMQTDKKAAARYCAMRIRSVLQLQEKKRMPRPRFLDFKMMEADDAMLDFMKERTAFLEDTYAYIQKKLLMLVIVFSVILGFGLTLLRISMPVMILVCFMFAAFNYLVMFGKLKRKFDRKQTLALVDYVDEELKEMDRPILYS